MELLRLLKAVFEAHLTLVASVGSLMLPILGLDLSLRLFPPTLRVGIRLRRP